MRARRFAAFAVLSGALALVFASRVLAQADLILAPVLVEDVPFDDGTHLAVLWDAPVDSATLVMLLRMAPDGTKDTVFSGPQGPLDFVDHGLAPGAAYHYEVVTADSAGQIGWRILSTTPVVPQADWFDRARTGELLLVLALFGVILYGTFRAGEIFVRPIGGLKAMEEALGRAVEMGRPVLFSAGWGAQLDKPTTMAALNIFGWLAGKAAEYGARLTFPAHDAVIMTAAQEASHDAAQAAGKPDWYRPGEIYYVTGSQFGYAAALDGVMERERPAANLWLGTFAAEALILSETGNHVGAMQIAGTDSTIQLAFFLVTCDYTLIGEELFAASGYLTRDRRVLGGLWAQDMLKIAAAATLAVGLAGAHFGWHAIGDWLAGL
jgi:hypothetical protein